MLRKNWQKLNRQYADKQRTRHIEIKNIIGKVVIFQSLQILFAKLPNEIPVDCIFRQKSARKFFSKISNIIKKETYGKCHDREC